MFEASAKSLANTIAGSQSAIPRCPSFTRKFKTQVRLLKCQNSYVTILFPCPLLFNPSVDPQKQTLGVFHMVAAEIVHSKIQQNIIFLHVSSSMERIRDSNLQNSTPNFFSIE